MDPAEICEALDFTLKRLEREHPSLAGLRGQLADKLSVRTAGVAALLPKLGAFRESLAHNVRRMFDGLLSRVPFDELRQWGVDIGIRAWQQAHKRMRLSDGEFAMLHKNPGGRPNWRHNPELKNKLRAILEHASVPATGSYVHIGRAGSIVERFGMEECRMPNVITIAIVVGVLARIIFVVCVESNPKHQSIISVLTFPGRTFTLTAKRL